mmetsp:Transcript_129835/g.403832  ORF Transcript_129835/g.403832 Transcript_129835/m.403832 type:complete len:159 (-) Transcript_129835:97-573(-)
MGPSAKAALLAGLIGSTVALHGRDLSFNDTEGEDRDDDNGECKKRGGEEAWETFKELQERPRPLKPEDVDGYERLLDPDVKIEDGEGDTIVGPHKFVAGISEATPDRFTGEESNILDDQAKTVVYFSQTCAELTWQCEKGRWYLTLFEMREGDCETDI